MNDEPAADIEALRREIEWETLKGQTMSAFLREIVIPAFAPAPVAPPVVVESPVVSKPVGRLTRAWRWLTGRE